MPGRAFPARSRKRQMPPLKHLSDGHNGLNSNAQNTFSRRDRRAIQSDVNLSGGQHNGTLACDGQRQLSSNRRMRATKDPHRRRICAKRQQGGWPLYRLGHRGGGSDSWGQSRLRFDNGRAKMLRPHRHLYYPACASGGPWVVSDSVLARLVVVILLLIGFTVWVSADRHHGAGCQNDCSSDISARRK